MVGLCRVPEMSLFSSKNITKAKSLLDKNRHKVGGIVGKATTQLDKVSKGKTASVSAKVDEAARKYSAGASGSTADSKATGEGDSNTTDTVDDDSGAVTDTGDDDQSSD